MFYFLSPTNLGGTLSELDEISPHDVFLVLVYYLHDHEYVTVSLDFCRIQLVCHPIWLAYPHCNPQEFPQKCQIFPIFRLFDSVS